MLGLARGLLHMKAGCKGEISYLSEFQSELYERNPHAACIDALSTHRPTIESPFNVDCIGVYGRSLLTLHSIETRLARSPPCPISRPLARSPTARSIAHPPRGRSGRSLAHSPAGPPAQSACWPARSAARSPSRPSPPVPLSLSLSTGPATPALCGACHTCVRPSRCGRGPNLRLRPKSHGSLLCKVTPLAHTFPRPLTSPVLQIPRPGPRPYSPPVPQAGKHAAPLLSAEPLLPAISVLQPHSRYMSPPPTPPFVRVPIIYPSLLSTFFLLPSASPLCSIVGNTSEPQAEVFCHTTLLSSQLCS